MVDGFFIFDFQHYLLNMWSYSYACVQCLWQAGQKEFLMLHYKQLILMVIVYTIGQSEVVEGE